MSRAYGWNAKLLIAEESTYGTLSSGPYTQVPFASSAIDSEQGLISSNVLGLGRDPTTPFQDVINVEGDLAVPVDLRNIGIWLKAVFGVPETTNENGVYTHTFESGKTTLPSYSLELGLAEVPEFIRFLGARANSIAFNFARSGEAQATVSLMAQSETASETKYNYRYLDRKLALEFLTDEWIAKNTLPQDMKIFGDGTLVASASIESLIEDTPNLQKLYLIIPENMENEDFSNSPIYRLVNRYNALNTQIILCVNEKTLGDDVKKTISLLSNLSNVSVKAIPEKLNDKIMAIVWDGFKYYSYASFDENVRQLNQYWGSNINTSILSGYIDINGLKFNDVKLETVENISYDKMFNISSEVNGPGYGFGNRLLSILASSLDKGISSPIVKIEYKDRYLKNPLASGLFYSFIKELKVRYEKLCNCASITLETAETTETNKQYPTMFYHDWDDVDARNEVLTALFDKIGLKFQLKEKNKKYLEHNRIMTIELENGEKINLILDQGFSYWRCLAYCYAENIFPFDADIDEQVAKIGQWLPNVSGDTYPTRIFYTKSK